jgi:hypothetical protein
MTNRENISFKFYTIQYLLWGAGYILLTMQYGIWGKVADPDTHGGDPHYFRKLDPDPH